MKNLMMDETMRMDIILANSFDFFPAPFVPLIKTFLKTKEHYIIFIDHAELPMWRVERDNNKRAFVYSLGESVHYDISILLCDTGSVYADFFCLTDKKFI
jgi:hypothetical protein